MAGTYYFWRIVALLALVGLVVNIVQGNMSRLIVSIIILIVALGGIGHSMVD